MRIGVISDTHMPRSAERLPEKICEDFKNVDLILHAGDLTEMDVLTMLEKIAPVKAVYGNMDDPVVQKSLPFKEIVEAGKCRIGLIHGFGPAFGLAEKIMNEFKDAKVNAIVFGHTHTPKMEVKNGILLFNPGSPTDKIFARFNSYGILKINDTIEGEIIKL